MFYPMLLLQRADESTTKERERDDDSSTETQTERAAARNPNITILQDCSLCLCV